MQMREECHNLTVYSIKYVLVLPLQPQSVGQN